MKNILFHKYISTPIGCLQITCNETALLSISFEEKPEDSAQNPPPILLETEKQLKEYFIGQRKYFSLNINPSGTAFQKEVWNWVEQVEFGKTESYLTIAKQTGSEKNTRAVGMANGKNPIPIIIPCHRIIGSNGKLTGYAGGLHRKRWLLQHEIKFSEKSGLLF